MEPIVQNVESQEVEAKEIPQDQEFALRLLFDSELMLAGGGNGDVQW